MMVSRSDASLSRPRSVKAWESSGIVIMESLLVSKRSNTRRRRRELRLGERRWKDFVELMDLIMVCVFVSMVDEWKLIGIEMVYKKI